MTRLSIFDSNSDFRLLSAAGIPKLRKKAKSHLKFKGKGHEVCIPAGFWSSN